MDKPSETPVDKNSNLHRLIYTSEACLPEFAPSRTGELDAIVDKARLANAAMGIGGALLHVRESFIQVLEGPLPALETVFERICCDFRHRRLKLVELSPVAERLFPDWSMAHLSQSQEPTRLRLNRDLEEIYFTVGINAATALRQMRAVLNQAGESLH